MTSVANIIVEHCTGIITVLKPTGACLSCTSVIVTQVMAFINITTIYNTSAALVALTFIGVVQYANLRRNRNLLLLCQYKGVVRYVCCNEVCGNADCISSCEVAEEREDGAELIRQNCYVFWHCIFNYFLSFSGRIIYDM